MELDPVETAVEVENIELARMTRRFWGGVALTLPIAVLAMSEFLLVLHAHCASGHRRQARLKRMPHFADPA